MMKRRINSPQSTTALAALPQPSIRDIAAEDFPPNVHALWREAGSILETAGVVDSRHLVLVFSVDYASLTATRNVPREVLKYTDNEEHAPYKAECLKMATLRHYRSEHQDLEGTWDPMEGKIRVVSTLEEYCARHGVRNTSQGDHHVAADVTYGTENTNLVYCTSRAEYRQPRYGQWRVGSVIRNVPKLSLLLGAEFARQFDKRRYAPVTPLDRLFTAILDASGLERVVQIHHGCVIYRDDAAEVLFSKIPHHAQGLAAHFFKRSRFMDQYEYRFVLNSAGSRPLADQLYLRITPELRALFGTR